MKRLLVCAAVLAAAISAHAQPAPDQAQPPANAPHRAAVVTRPEWTRLPTGNDMAAYYPRGANTSGLVRLECVVTADGGLEGCVAEVEDPPDQGFGKAAVAMSHLFKMKPETRDGQPVSGAMVTIPIRFTLGVLPPQWLRPPTAEELQSVWPANAPADGGMANIDCQVTAEGHAKHCTVISETPSHSGFGSAAVKLSPRFQLSAPKELGGDKTVSADVHLTVAFNKPQPTQTGVEAYGQITALRNAPWKAAPTSAEMAAAWPVTAPAGLDRVVVRVLCGFSEDTSLARCEVLSEEPAGHGLGAAALKLTERFRTRSAFIPDAVLGKARIILRFDFLDPKTASQQPVWLDKPNWVSFIPAGRMTALYPAAAVDAGIKTGRGVVTCTVAPDGTLTACALESEDPPGKGFGQAALAAVGDFAVNPWTDGGRPTDGAKIRVPIRFNESEPAPPAASGDAKAAPAAPAKTSP
jgi:TonB family protein